MIIVAFVVMTPLLCLWGVANWYEWSMADFDCADGYWECRRSLVGPVALQMGLPIAAWLVLAGLLVREWKKA
ncbi:MAG: hypothetical protein K2W86_13775 [Sphingomonas sp.]|uniref:hypothetical protein n=1 Tax=Sphingomonas sp. TaxID=28214 RepID=UPI0035A86B9D|nr:hypothetical protein [Sphingomonas sp.]